MEMYGDQFRESVCGYWGLKGYPHVHILHTDLHTFPDRISRMFPVVRQIDNFYFNIWI